MAMRMSEKKKLIIMSKNQNVPKPITIDGKQIEAIFILWVLGVQDKQHAWSHYGN